MWVVRLSCTLAISCLLNLREVRCFCRAKAYEVPGDVMFNVILSVRESDGQESCSTVSYEALQNILAFNYSIGKLNQLGGNGQEFIPGVKLGYRIYDDCGESNISSAYALDILRRQFPKSVTHCAEKQDTLFAGVIGASISSTTKIVARSLRNSEFPIISIGGTLSEFSNKTFYPNLLRTVYPDTEQIKAILSLLESLKWTRFVLIHTDEEYGNSAAQGIQQLAKQKGICVSLVQVLPINSLVTAQNIFLEVQKQEDSYGGSIGVVFIGQRAGAEIMIRTARSLREPPNQNFIDSIMWVFSESLGTNSRVLLDGQPFSNGILTISMVSIEIPEFKSFIENEMAKQQSSSNQWVREFFEKNCVNTKSRCSAFELNDFIPPTLDAVYALAVALKESHRRHCRNVPGICEEMKKDDMLKNVMEVAVDYNTMDPIHVPPSFIKAERSIRFDKNADVVPSNQQARYQYNMFSDSSFEIVGRYGSTAEVNLTLLQTHTNLDGSTGFKTSACNLNCQECRPEQSFIYIPGDVIVLVFISIHQTPKQYPYRCRETRTTTNTIPSLEALLYLFDDQLKNYSGQSFGLLVFDDCYSVLKAGQIMSDLFSGKTILVDEKTGDVINASSIVAVLGPEPSGIAVPIAQGLKTLMLPQVSFAASSPELDDRTLYPYFLRPVPSDKIQAKVMIEIVKSMKWNYIDIVFTNNNYGLKGMQKISEFAAMEGICVGNAFEIDEKPKEIDLGKVIRRLSVTYAKVVLFFGTGESAKALLKTLKNYEGSFTFVASEDWGVNPRAMEGLEELALGSLIVTLDTSRVVWNQLPQHLLEKSPSENDINPWFAEFWQEKFECNLPWLFSRTAGRPDCKPDIRLSKQDVDGLVSDQRIVHTMNSLYAIISGLITARKLICANVETLTFICDKIRQNPDVVTNIIKQTRLFDGNNEFRPFLDDGNGNIGFNMLNLRRDKELGTYKFVKVGEYTSNGFRLNHDEIKLYSLDKERIEISRLSSECTVNCTKCKVAKSISESGLPMWSKGISPKWIATLTITCLLCLLVIGVIVILVKKRRKPEEKYKLEESQYSKKTREEPHMIIQNPSTDYTFSGGRSGSITSYGLHHERNDHTNPAFYLGSSDNPEHRREFMTGYKSSVDSVNDCMEMANVAEAESITCSNHPITRAEVINPQKEVDISNHSTSFGSSLSKSGACKNRGPIKCRYCEDEYIV